MSLPPITEIRVPNYDYVGCEQPRTNLIQRDPAGGENGTLYRYEIPVGEGAVVVGYVSEQHPGILYIDSRLEASNIYIQGYWYIHLFKIVDATENVPFQADVVQEGHTREALQHVREQVKTLWGGYSDWKWVVKRAEDRYGTREYGTYQNNTDRFPYIYLGVKITAGDVTKTAYLRFQSPERGVLDFGRDDVETPAGKLKCQLVFHGLAHEGLYSANTYRAARFLFSHMEILPSPAALWAHVLRAAPQKPDLRSIKSVSNRKDIAPVLTRLREEQPLLWRFWNWLLDGSTWNKASNNQLLAVFLAEYGNDYDKMVQTIEDVMAGAPTLKLEGSDYSNEDQGWKRAFCVCFPGAQGKVEEEKAKKQWQFHQSTTAKAEALGVSQERHPLTWEAIGKGDLPLNLFHEPGNKDHLVNIEWDLWERALAREGWAKTLFSISQNASGRSTYTHHITSYIAFLFKIEQYLDKHAPRPKRGRVFPKWKAMPTFVESQWQLEMDEANENGTVKKRSALTPQADNEKGVVTVPYAAMSISGRQTTWCYSDRYYVVEEGMNDPEGKGVFDKEMEPRLNGRDDYGLMWYTLTGTDRNRGYPSFLVIFERLTTGHRVHFHRVHPSRYRGPEGTDTPSCRLIQECYRYMAGNVRAEDIYAQQGDMIYIQHDNDPIAAGAKVEDPQEGPSLAFESHAMVPQQEGAVLRLFVSKAKTPRNRLGFVQVPEGGMDVRHPEHEDIIGVPAGWYEIFRCRSWEANPTSVWSFSID